jgi:periplasmic protein TonB
MRRAIAISIFIHCLAFLLVFKNGFEKQKAYPPVMMVHLSSPPPMQGVPNPATPKSSEAITPPKKVKTPEPPPKDARTTDINLKKKPKVVPKQKTAPPSEEPQTREEMQEAKSKGLPQGVNLGSEFGSASLDATGFESPTFLNILFNKIRIQWENPFEGSEGITCTIYFVVDREGQITDYTVEKSSGISAYDQAALRAVMSTKAPPLPNQFGSDQLGIHLEFQYIPGQ